MCMFVQEHGSTTTRQHLHSNYIFPKKRHLMPYDRIIDKPPKRQHELDTRKVESSYKVPHPR